MSETIYIDSDGSMSNALSAAWRGRMLTPEAGAIVHRWRSTRGDLDGQISGILADYVEENPHHFDVPEEGLARLVSWLRARFHDPSRNQ